MRSIELLLMTEIHLVKNVACLMILLFRNQMQKKALKDIRVSNMNKLIFGLLNINSLRNKFDVFSEQVNGSIYILMVAETKLDDSFPEAQFLIEGFHSPFKFDRNINGGGIMLYVQKDIPTSYLVMTFQAWKAFL